MGRRDDDDRSRNRDKRKGGKHRRPSATSSSDSSPEVKKKSKKHRRARDSSSSPEVSSKKHKKSKKSRRRSRSSSPDAARKQVLDLEERKEQHKKHKELMKAYETPEEKRLRRLGKKEAKERKRKMNMGWDHETLQYTNEDNPFGDHNLTETFVWGSKLKKEGKSISREEVIKGQRSKMEENKRELEKVKKRRLEREREKEQRDEERELEQRSKESEFYSAWEKQEDSFHLNQAKMRSKIRIEDGRAKPIDLLAKYINAEDDDMSVEMHEPYTYLDGLFIEDLEDLIEDIKTYLELEEGKNQDYWRDITTVTEDQLSQLRRMDPRAMDMYMRDRREGIHTSVTTEVNAVFKGKTLKQLNILEEQIKKKLRGGEGVDVGYWESLLQQLKAHIARTRLKERHQDILKQKLARLKEEQYNERVDSPTVKREPRTDSPVASGSGLMPPPAIPSTSTKQEADENDDFEGPKDSRSSNAIEESDDGPEDYDSGRYSPALIPQGELEEGSLIYNAQEDMRRLEYQRQQLKTTGKIQNDGGVGELVKRARTGMDDDEAQFSVEFNLEQQNFVWSDKYRPRKPRFFNRVHTGFEWNKYNQTHYDMDNPPPKIVQGYKFNIFYPDLIDKSKTPEYTVTPIADDPDFSILKFSAGPPYEDIAFKIVSREWEHSYRRGFKCQFHNDIFQLWFHFRRYRYRR